MAKAAAHLITDVRFTTTKRDGTPLVTKGGKPMWATDIQIAERPGLWINGLVFRDPSAWKGTTRRLELSVQDYQGTAQPKFKDAEPASGAGGAAAQVALLTRMCDALESIDARLARLEKISGVGRADEAAGSDPVQAGSTPAPPAN